MRGVLISIVAGVALAGAGESYAQTKTYDVVTDFKTNANPNGPWSFYDTANGLLNVPLHDLDNRPGWYALTNGYDSGRSFTYVAKNKTGSPITQGTVVAPVHALALVSGWEDSANIRFTAPATGVYRVKIELTGIQTDETSHGVEINTNKHILCTGTIAMYQQVFQCYRTTTLKAGEIIFLGNGPSATQMGDVGVAVVFNVKGPIKSGN